MTTDHREISPLQQAHNDLVAKNREIERLTERLHRQNEEHLRRLARQIDPPRGIALAAFTILGCGWPALLALYVGTYGWDLGAMGIGFIVVCYALMIMIAISFR